IVNSINGSGIIYVRNRKKTKEVTAFLQKNRIGADYYHAGIENKLKDHKQNSWKLGKTRIIVSTNAFGMGIDKADVRFVIHMDLPDSLEAYYQEAGRAGRDGKQAFAVLLYHASDEGKLKKRIQTNFPEKEFIKRVYEALGNYYQLPIGAGKGRMLDFRISDFASKFKLPILQTYSALKLLGNEGYLELSEEFFSFSKIMFIAQQKDLYKFQVENKKFDPFIKLLMRTYEGIFTNYVNIDEEFIARKARSKTELVFDYLQKLNQLNVIKYIPKRKLPFIFYTEERLEEKNLRISKENYEIRKDNYLKRINSVLNYASSHNKCRSQILLAYFDDKDSSRCGQCDVCRRRNELELSKYEFDIILENIKPKLLEEELSMEELINSCKFLENKLFKVISWLTENDKIILTEKNKYKWI
ncbi:MAG: RecQ family ATP-dependent DNA helicase, partial [Bacteroidetes bacterium]